MNTGLDAAAELVKELLATGGSGHVFIGRAGAGLLEIPDVCVIDLDTAEPGSLTADAPHRLVAVIAHSLTDLRRVASLAAVLPKARRVVIVVAETPRHAPMPTLALPWKDVRGSEVRRLGTTGWCLDIHFTIRMAAGPVLWAAARTAREGIATPDVALSGSADLLWRPADPLAAIAGHLDGRPDLTLPGTALRSAGGHVVDPGAIPPVDERSVNPVGFLTRPDAGTGVLVQSGGGWIVRLGEDTVTLVPVVTDVVVAKLRALRALRIPAAAPAGLIAGLAAAGVPLVCDEPLDLLPVPGVTEAALADDLTREEHSVRLRRHALRTYGNRAYWRGVGARAGLPQAVTSPVSVLLATRRPERIAFALGQIARQRDVDLEVLVALHGVPDDLPEVRAAIQDFAHPLTVVASESSEVFGGALNRAAARASGRFLAKMDDDDWYGPDFLADLTLAHIYTGAQVVGCMREFVYLEELHQTVRQNPRPERFDAHISGSAMLIEREAFCEVGGFRPLPRVVDLTLVRAIGQAGGRVYRTHALNHVVRRAASGHTWNAPIGHFLHETVAQWRGFRPSRLMEMT